MNQKDSVWYTLTYGVDEEASLSLYIDLQHLKWLAQLNLPVQGSTMLSNAASSKYILSSWVYVLSYPVVFFKISCTVYI